MFGGGGAHDEYTRRLAAVARMEESVEEDEAVVCGAGAREEKGVEEEVESLRGQLARLHAQVRERARARGGERERAGRERGRERERVCVCVCVSSYTCVSG